MKLYGSNSKSIPQKIIIHLIELLLLWLSYFILFQNGTAWLGNNFQIDNVLEYYDRRMIIFVFNIITFLRISYTMIFLLKRKIPWEESFSIPFAFALYFIGFSFFVLPTSKQIDFIDICGIIIFLIGCILNTGSEIMRDNWKRNVANKGKIYTEGFFKYSRHINYFGDLLWVVAYSIITRNWFSISIPIFLFCFFAFYNAPKLDKYLKNKYGKQFDNYARKTKMLIPFIY